MKTQLNGLLICLLCLHSASMPAQTRELQLAEETARRASAARAQFDALDSAAIESALASNDIWLNEPLRAGAALRALVAKNDARAVVRVLLLRLDGDTERKRSGRESTGTETEANAIFHSLFDGGSRIVPFWIAELATRPIASSATQQVEFRTALNSMLGSSPDGVALAIDRYLGSLPEGAAPRASDNLRANLGLNILPTLRPLLPDAKAPAAELALALASEDLWLCNGVQAMAGLKALLEKDELLAFPIIAQRFDGWSQKNPDWVDVSERPAEPYSLMDVVGTFDAPRAQRFLDWLAGQNLDAKLTFSQKARLGRSLAWCFASRESFNAALLAAASKQPDSQEAARRIQLILAARLP